MSIEMLDRREERSGWRSRSCLWMDSIERSGGGGGMSRDCLCEVEGTSGTDLAILAKR
jgi:hypothetical protein